MENSLGEEIGPCIATLPSSPGLGLGRREVFCWREGSSATIDLYLGPCLSEVKSEKAIKSLKCLQALGVFFFL